MLHLSRSDVIAEARTWLEVPWIHQGRSRTGVDCAGLVVCVLDDLGLPVEDMLGYRRSPDGVLFRQHIFKQTTPAIKPAPGCIAMFRESRFPTHTGFFAEKDGKLTIIHAYLPYGKVVEEPFIHDWPEKLVATRNIIGLID